MPPAPLPDNEEARLATLVEQKILDTDPDPRFDSVVRMAADVFATPIALISLVDRHRQWFKAGVGLPDRETHRDHAFCAHAIRRPHEVLVVEDATLDPRFSDNPLVIGDPKIRFYAGASICAPNGDPLGTLCVIDHAPRRMSAAERARLQELACNAGTLIELHRSNVELVRAGTHDPQTGLANRSLFESRLDTAVQDALAGRPCAVLLADLDDFKNINHTLGHAVGDALIVAVARRLSHVVRGADLVARIGGDSFALLLNGPVDTTTAAAVSRRVVNQFTTPFQIGGDSITVGVSVGTALCPIDALERRGLLRAADLALYEAKRSGRGRIALADRHPEQGAPVQSGLSSGRAMEAALQDAMANDELALHWQPVFDTGSGRVEGFEALLRWTHPVHGAVAPSLFLPVAEATGLIAKLDCWVLRTACRSAAVWPGRFTIAVNLSAHWFSEGGVADFVREALRDFGLAAGRLEVELTERTVISSRDMARSQMEALRALGVHIALDDFGTGYSSLAYLRQFPFDKVKLDRAFIAPLGEDRKADAVARAIIRLGHALDMKVCGEGVETAAQLAFLRREGCDLAQGYLLGRPAAAPRTDSFCFATSSVPTAQTNYLPVQHHDRVLEAAD